MSYRCQRCPPGLRCDGTAAIDAVVKGSVWTADSLDGLYKLIHCPMGYYKVSEVDSWDQQQCVPCPEGEECVLEVCDVCTACKPGTYKDAPDTLACRACPVGTYNPDENSKDFTACRSCPPGSTTYDKFGLTDALECECRDNFYRVDVGLPSAVISCSACPSGAVCASAKGFCALRLESKTCPGSTAPILGDWKLIDSGENAGKFQLQTCPEGHQLRGAPHDDQQCIPCNTVNEYIIDPVQDECQPCPVGLRCRGNSQVELIVENSVWQSSQGIYQLIACPRGHSKISLIDGTASSAPLQQCVVCKEGTECLEDICSVCEPCPPGKYKDTPGSHSCRNCPPNTYNPFENGKEYSSCRPCPSGAETLGDGQISAEACRCSDRHYLVAGDGTTTCAKCPKGLECDADGSCSIRSSFDYAKPSCPAGSTIPKGVWTLTSQGVSLISCPTGFRLVNQTGDEMQHCQQCADGEYMDDSAVPMLECRLCPPQGVCPNKGRPIFNVKPVASTLVLDGEIKEEQLDDIIASIATTLGVDPVRIEIPGFGNRRQSSRRSPVSITFTVFVDPKKADSLSEMLTGDSFSSQLASELGERGVEATFQGLEAVQVIVSEEKMVGTIERIAGVYKVVNCPKGYLLVNESDLGSSDPGSCLPCERETYSTSPFEGCTESPRHCAVRLCNECPSGATCSGGLDVEMNHFQPKHGIWEVEPTDLPLGGQMLRMRIRVCQEGYKLLRGSSGSYTRDQCEICEYGKMALGEAVYDPAHKARLEQCFECETLTGVVCQGGMLISPKAGYWIDPMLVLEDYANSSMFDPGFAIRPANNARNLSRTHIRAGDHVFSFDFTDDGNISAMVKFGTVLEWKGWDSEAVVKFAGSEQGSSVPAEFIMQRTLKAYRCAAGACLSDWTCAEGHYGRACGLCNASYVLSSEGCTFCEEYYDGDLAAVIICSVLGLLIIWYLTVWRPWLQIFEQQEMWVAEKVAIALSAVTLFVAKILNKLKTQANREEEIRRLIAGAFRSYYIIG